MRVRRRRTLLLVLMAWLATACERVEPPVAELSRVRLGGVGLGGATLIAELVIDNPNEFAIATDSITFELDARDSSDSNRWTRVTDGINREAITIAAGGRQAVEIPIELAFSNLTTPVRSILDKGTFNYRVSGVVSVREPRRTTAPFTQTGNLSLLGGR